ncbi:hypothetical protein PLUTE_a2676 [Pseudoalteromonas luteoviolacea DSM 6061]|nr:hypothetical protein [Pseudoalteromonas luteoviolacea DSM 6061]
MNRFHLGIITLIMAGILSFLQQKKTPLEEASCVYILTQFRVIA